MMYLYVIFLLFNSFKLGIISYIDICIIIPAVIASIKLIIRGFGCFMSNNAIIEPISSDIPENRVKMNVLNLSLVE